MTYRELLNELLGPDVTPDQLDRPVVITRYPIGTVPDAKLHGLAVGVDSDSGEDALGIISENI